MHWRASTKGSDQLGIARQVRTFAKQHYDKAHASGSHDRHGTADETGSIISKKTQKLWIWKVKDSDDLRTPRLGVGSDRSGATLKRMLDRLEVRDVQFYWTDEWEAYASPLPAEKLIRSKEVTGQAFSVTTAVTGIGLNASVVRASWSQNQRKWSILPCLALFARFRVNGSVYDILSLTI